VLDPSVLQLLNVVQRENFVPCEYAGLAFADIEVPIGYGQTMLHPKLEARMLQALNLQKTHTVLHIGTGSGYFTALLASLAKRVTSIDINANLIQTASNNINKQNLVNVTLQMADGAQSYTDKTGLMPMFDIIVFTASSPVEPLNMRNQLNIGGTMLIVLGQAPVMQATLIQRVSATGFKQNILFETCLPVLDNATQAETFEF
jgi:protein-L-isoaspartate(D-aspartate) O-methyltransferase